MRATDHAPVTAVWFVGTGCSKLLVTIPVEGDPKRLAQAEVYIKNRDPKNEFLEYQQIKHLQLALRRLTMRKFGMMITFLEYRNLDATTNHVERTNRWFRKRQKTHYRNRKERTIRNMLNADLMRWAETMWF